MRLISTVVVLFVTGSVHAGGVQLEPVTFEFEHPTVSGQSIFVVGDIPELGDNDLTRSVKLAPVGPVANGTLWRATIAIPQGVTYSADYTLRFDSLASWGNPTNGTVVGPPVTGQTPDPATSLRTLSLFVAASLGVGEATFETVAGPVDVPLLPHPGQPDFLVGRLGNQPKGPRFRASVGTSTIDSWGDTLLLRDVSVYTYWPRAFSFPAGRIADYTLPTSTVPHTRTVDGISGRGFRVYTPRGYDEQPHRRYPVLYMHDGQNVFRPGGPFGSWDAEFAANVAIRDARIPELLIVAVDNSSNRAAEYVPELGNFTVTNEDYNSFLVDELKPWIDANFRTLPEREHTAVLGSSFGGLASLVLGLEHGDTFGTVAAMSPSFWMGATRSRIEAGELPGDVRVYLDAGDTNDGGVATVAVRDTLLLSGRVHGDDLFFQLGYNHAHNEPAWKARLPFALEFIIPLRDQPRDLERWPNRPSGSPGTPRSPVGVLPVGR